MRTRLLALKRRWLVLGFGTLFLGVAAWFEPTCVVRGWLCGEAFYLGRPTSYWSRELGHWNGPSPRGGYCPSHFTVYRNEVPVTVDLAAAAVGGNNTVITAVNWTDFQAAVKDRPDNTIGVNLGYYYREPSLVDKLVGYVGVKLTYPDWPPILTGDPAAEPVLRGLADDPSEVVRKHAEGALRRDPDWSQVFYHIRGDGP
jgi:hypothetical protein